MQSEIKVCDIPKHEEHPEPHCLRCFLPEGAYNLRVVGRNTYVVDLPKGGMFACEQGSKGWHEVTPPRDWS